MHPQGTNNNPTKPPPATRHRVVMLLCQPIPLHGMQSQMSSCLQGIVESSQNAHKVMMVRTVPTDRVSRAEDDPTYVELGITFFYPDDHENQPLKMDANVIMPKGWTPKMYLAALKKSMKRHSILSLELITIDGQIYATVNKLQWLFFAMEEATHSQLIASASYIRVSGDILKNMYALLS
jgi:hypothetical protein